MPTRLAVSLVVAVCVLAAPATASAVSYSGKTSQGYKMRMRTAANGAVDPVVIKWRADCRRPGYRIVSITNWRNRPANPIERNGNTFGDSGRRTVREGSVVLIFDEVLTGRFRANGRVTGTHKASVRVQRRGRTIDRCGVRVRWSARAS